MVFISSPANERIREVQRLHTPRARKKSGFFLMEGPHLLETVLDLQIIPYEVYYQPDMLQRSIRGRRLLDRLKQTSGIEANRLVEVSERVIAILGEVQTSQGVICVLPLSLCTAGSVHKRRLRAHRRGLLILDRIADPGNMGTILRTALAADVDMVLLTPNCVDYFNPKVVRAAAGAHIMLPVASDLSWAEIETRVTAHCGSIRQVLLADIGSDHMYYAQDLTLPFALIIGNEAHGPSPQARALATQTITIPLANHVESLNAAMATSIILYEAVRQQHMLARS